MFDGFLINTIFLCFWFSRNVPRKQSRYISILEICIYELWHAWESMFNGFLINTIFLCFLIFKENVSAKTVQIPSVLEICIYELWHAWESMFDGFLINTIFFVFLDFQENVPRKTVQIPFCPWNMYLWIMTRMGKHVWWFFNKHNFFVFLIFKKCSAKTVQDTFLSLKYISMNYDMHGESMFNGFLINTIFLCFWFSRNVLRKQSRYLSVLEI